VKYCRLYLDGASFGSELGYPAVFALHVFLKFTAHDGVARIKGSASVQPLLPTDPTQKQDKIFNPDLRIFAADNVTSWNFLGPVKFPFAQSSRASASPLTATFEFPTSNGHVYYLAAPSANSSCSFNPRFTPNVIDHRGFEVPDVGRDPKLVSREAYIVMPPFVNMVSHMDKFATLLDRHIQWHKALGFSRHILYMRAADILIFSEINAVKHWIKRQQLLLVLWEIFPTPKHETPYWDQRLVYNHAMLAFSNAPSPVWLANINLDEYLMSSNNSLNTFNDMARECSETNPALSLQVPSYSVVREEAREPVGSDIVWWVKKAFDPEDKHPLIQYNTVSWSQPTGQAIYRPDFAHTIHSHVASIFEEFKHTVVNSDGSGCMFLLHIKQLYKAEQLSEEFKLEVALGKALQLRADKMPKVNRLSNWLFNSVTNTSDPWVRRKSRRTSLLQKFMAF
jgi:hypothetical protein